MIHWSYCTTSRNQTGLLDNLSEIFKVTCVLASSPDLDNWRDFYKASDRYATFILPTLTLAEAHDFVQSTANPVPDSATVSKWFEMVGGVPRHLTSQAAVDAAVLMQKNPTKQNNPTKNLNLLKKLNPKTLRIKILLRQFT